MKVQLTYADGYTLDKFRQVIAARIKWCNESAQDACAACVINTLKSLRSKCKVANKTKILKKMKIKVDSSLVVSGSQRGKDKVAPCLRLNDGRTRYTLKNNETIRWNALSASIPFSQHKVYRVERLKGDKVIHYLIPAPDAQSAMDEISRVDIARYVGLAKRALSFLMMKTVTQTVKDERTSPWVEVKADNVTKKTDKVKKTGDGGTYTLTLSDSLKYALCAIRGGKSEVNNSLKRAMNKSVSVINQKLKKNRTDFFAPGKLATPFPELARKRKK